MQTIRIYEWRAGEVDYRLAFHADGTGCGRKVLRPPGACDEHPNDWTLVGRSYPVVGLGPVETVRVQLLGGEPPWVDPLCRTSIPPIVTTADDSTPPDQGGEGEMRVAVAEAGRTWTEQPHDLESWDRLGNALVVWARAAGWVPKTAEPSSVAVADLSSVCSSGLETIRRYEWWSDGMPRNANFRADGSFAAVRPPTDAGALWKMYLINGDTRYVNVTLIGGPPPWTDANDRIAPLVAPPNQGGPAESNEDEPPAVRLDLHDLERIDVAAQKAFAHLLLNSRPNPEEAAREACRIWVEAERLYRRRPPHLKPEGQRSGS